MSFSSNVKRELCNHFGNARHCNIAELAGIINICGQIVKKDNSFCVKIQTENFDVAKKCFTLLQNAFNIRLDISVHSSGKKRHSYLLLLRDTQQIRRVLQACGIHYDVKTCQMEHSISALVTGSICCRRAYLRGASLPVGFVNNPNKNYQLEFVMQTARLAEQLREMMYSFSLEAKIVPRKEHFVVYLKEGEQIVDLLNVMGAHVALMELENVRIVKEMRNDINRKVNCETANLNKVVGAAVKQLEDISYIQQTIGLHKLSPQLQELAEVRLQYPDKSLKELGMLLSEPVGKSGVNHRLRKISRIAETLREGKGEAE